MKTEDKDLIEKKLRRQLTLEEEYIFSAKLKDDEEFREEYSLEKQLFENLNDTDWNLIENPQAKEVKEYTRLFESEETRKLAAQLQATTKEYREKSATEPVRQRLYWLSGLAAAILIALISILIMYQNGESTEQLYASYLDLSEIPSMIPRGDSEEELLVRAQELFENKEYEEAIPLFDEILSTNTESTATVLIYKGISQMESGQVENALPTFIQLKESDLLDASKGYWYMALVYIKMGKVQDAKVILEKIKSESLYNSLKASELLEKL
ncbi:MAG: tetratricopeptide repeat protein [Cyclobacteriaceae bacterium]